MSKREIILGALVLVLAVALGRSSVAFPALASGKAGSTSYARIVANATVPKNYTCSYSNADADPFGTEQGHHTYCTLGHVALTTQPVQMDYLVSQGSGPWVPGSGLIILWKGGQLQVVVPAKLEGIPVPPISIRYEAVYKH